MMKDYKKTKWVDGKTPVNAQNLNKIEDAVKYLFDNSLSKDSISEGEGLTLGKEGEVSVSKEGLLGSKTVKGIEILIGGTQMKEDILYLFLNPTTLKLEEIFFNNTSIWCRE